MFKNNNKDIRMTTLTLFYCIVVKFKHFSSISIVHFEQANVCWEVL